ncbi:hypothetical protein BU17DRAFT_85133 [Hysterangium stoloniferum]|nr:hypothetical protein BU17DRAFT_85133 [Hysterangium stoloniferum]
MQRFFSFFKGLRGSQALLRVILRLWRLLVPFVSANAKPTIPDHIDRTKTILADGISDTVICASVMPTANFVELTSSASASQCPSLPSTSASVAAITFPPRPQLDINPGRRRSTADSLATIVGSPSSFTPSWKKGKLPGPFTIGEEEECIGVDFGEVDLSDSLQSVHSSPSLMVFKSPCPKPKPLNPEFSQRYRPRKPPTYARMPIYAGPPSLTRGRRASLPHGWEMYVHPEGQPYFITQWTESPYLAVITDNNVWEKDVATRVVDFAHLLFGLLNGLGHGDLNSSNVDLVVSIDMDQDKDQDSYYFIHHERTSIFWLYDLSDDDVDYPILDLFTGYDHLQLKIRKLYWIHQEFFPHRAVPNKWLTELVSTLSFDLVDIATSPMPTCPYGRQEVDAILLTLKNMQDYNGLVRTAIIGRAWALIYDARFTNCYGEPEARLYRKQIAVGGWATPHPLMKVVFLALFDTPSVHLSTLHELYDGGVLYREGWRKWMDQLFEGWGEIILQATVLLTGDPNMGFLAVFNSTQQVAEENLVVTCSMASTLLSTASIVIGLLHVREFYHQQFTGSDEFLNSKSKSFLDLQPLAILYSLPYALLMWAMVSFIAAILLYVFKSGVSTHSEIILGALAFALGATLICVIQFFWKDDLKLKEYLQSLCNILTQLSPLSLLRRWRDI